MPYIEDQIPAIGLVRTGKRLQIENQRASTKEGIMVGLFDMVTDNIDRHSGNWLTEEKEGPGKITLIDHGHAWQFQDDPTIPKNMVSPFDSALGIMYQGMTASGRRWKNSEVVSPADLDKVEKALNKVKPEFQRLGRLDWHKKALDRLAAMRPYAKG